MTGATVQVSKTIPAPPGEVWRALTTPKIIKSYFFGADVDTDWKVGSPIYFRGAWKGARFEDKGQIKAFEPEKRLTFSHWSPLSGQPDEPENYHVVSYELTPSRHGTNVILTQANVGASTAEITAAAKQEFENNWRMVLDGLQTVLAK